MIPSVFKQLGKFFLSPDYRKQYFAIQKLKKIQRYTTTHTNLLGTEIELVDNASFLFMYREIFEQQIYRFKAKNQKPFIIDGGANIGLSVIYFKRLYPQSNIVAFEPDTKVFKVLENNIHKFELYDVKLVNKALWSSETTLEFMSEGADAGRVIQLESDLEKYQVPTVRLRDYLSQTVDFLKLDIEGAETEVIKDCQDLLFNVDNLFVEYHSFVNEPQTLNIIINILSEAEFRIHIHPSVTSPQPFYHRHVYLGMDIQLNIFAFRE
ncbi:MAG: FkbM family methyltransferase [Xenococcaceae cyanobacterium]